MSPAPLRIGPLGPFGPGEDTHVLLRGEGRWLVSARAVSTGCPLRLSDANPCGKVQVLAAPDSSFAGVLGVEVGHAELFAGGVLVASPAPGEWLALAPADGPALRGLLHELGASDGAVVVDRSAGLAALRLTGEAAADLLRDLGDGSAVADLADGRVSRAPVAGVTCTAIRDDLWPEQLAPEGSEVPSGAPLVTSFLLVCDRSQARELHAALLDAGAGRGIEAEGYAGYRAYQHDI